MNIRIIKIMVPIAVAAAATAAAVIMKGKNSGDNTKSVKSAKENKEEKVKVIKDLRNGTYSYMSGYTDARQVELSLNYDGETTSFDVIEDEFLCYSSDSHVAVVLSEDFMLQIEYAEFPGGEDYDKFKGELEEKYQGYEEITLPCGEACTYISGDSRMYCIPTAQSYALITVMPTKESDETPETLGNNNDLKAILNSVKVTIY